jgi:NFU1 iron-sulfur cluster scaffold homolog, mitochondrial
MSLNISAQPTPNPNALKFILNDVVKNEGNSTYRAPSECGENNLAASLFTIRGIDQLHFFSNTITITKFGYEPWDMIEPKVEDVLYEKFPEHNPNYYDPDPEAERRANLSEELLKIELILDKTIRPGLQGDGGDIQALSYEDDTLIVTYMGACGTCPSSTTGTLEAIKAILRDEFNPDIQVYIAPGDNTPINY